MDVALSNAILPTPIPRAGRVRGTEPCAHCGLPASEGFSLEHGGESLSFCCSGCRFVFGIIQDRGLGRFYELRQEPEEIPVPPTVFQRQNFSWLARECAARQGVLSLEVQGLSCVACVWLIRRIFETMDGAGSVHIDLLRGTMEMQVTPGEFPCEAFAETLCQMGYRVGPEASDKTRTGDRGLVIRIGVCGALAMNAMLFAVPSYCGLGAGERWSEVFAKGAMACATASMLVGASYFVGRAWRALRFGLVHMDLPIALGVVCAYAGSLVSWLQGERNALYFDFVSIFSFLMLLGRWLHQVAVDANRSRLLSTQLGFSQPNRGQTYEVQPGEVIPVRSRLLSGGTSLGMEWINGEAEARTVLNGQSVPSGAVHLGQEPLNLEALEDWGESLLSKLTAAPAPKEEEESSVQRFILVYLTAVLGVAGAGLLGWWIAGYGWVKALQVCVSVLVVSCPCASGVALPLVSELANARMRSRGVFVREGGLWRRLLKIRTVVFDKTGTLTTEFPRLLDPGSLRALRPDASAALVVLVGQSLHPVATSLREALGRAPASSGSTAMVEEVVGQGLEWVSQDARVWRLGRAAWAVRAEITGGDPSMTLLSVNGERVAGFAFEESLRSDACSEVASLQSGGFAVQILSGDHPERVSRVGGVLGLSKGTALGGLTPGDKALWVRARGALSPVLMLGDGANDSLAFAECLCSGTPAVDRGVLEQRADFYYLGRGLAGVRSLLEMASYKAKVGRRILYFTTFYNLAAITLALMGWMNPMLAAVLMPVSSAVTVLLVIHAFRKR